MGHTQRELHTCSFVQRQLDRWTVGADEILLNDPGAAHSHRVTTRVTGRVTRFGPRPRVTDPMVAPYPQGGMVGKKELLQWASQASDRPITKFDELKDGDVLLRCMKELSLIHI